jgi:aldehyde:ferredoxin oxidoreductase
MASYGWTGKMLRVNLTRGSISTEDTSKYKNFIGGMGFGVKILTEEVPPGTKPFDEAAKAVFTVGPLTGSGAPMSSRTNINFLTPFTRGYGPIDAHMGGHFAAQMKFAGFDAIIIEGKSATPVYLAIIDDSVTIEDASPLWGKGTRDTTEILCEQYGEDTCVAAIGPAGENLLPLSSLINSRNHSGGGGIGAVLGAKKLKAIAVQGNFSVPVANPAEVRRLNDYVLKELIGANNNHVVPSVPQAWAEYSSPRSRWNGHKGLFWEKAEGGPIETGDFPPGNINTVGYRTFKSVFDLGEEAAKYSVKMGGCQSCPIRCQAQLDIPKIKDFGATRTTGGNTCVAQTAQTNFFATVGGLDPDTNVMGSLLGSVTFDDLGMWCNYGQFWRDFNWCLTHKVFERVLPKAEYDAIHWEKIPNKDISFIKEIYDLIANNRGEIAYLAHGSWILAERWKLGKDYWDAPQNNLWNTLGSALHHSSENAGQVGALINCFWNRDAMCHSIINFTGSGLPYDIQKAKADKLWGAGALDPNNSYTPINDGKVKFAKWGILSMIIHNSATLCNWVWPMTVSPLKSRNYDGDLTVEAQFMQAVTGETYTYDSLYLDAERIFTLFRAYNTLHIKSKNMRVDHDEQWNGWVFDRDPDKKAFTAGTTKMDRADMQKALGLFYKEVGWDETTGIPTRATLERLGLGDIANQLASAGLLTR